jgi:hypothetical protein
MSQRDEHDVSRLARRFQAAIDQEAAVKRIAEEQARVERERLERSRGDLLDALEAFGRAVSWFEVERHGAVVILRYAERSLRFEAVGERGKVKVEGDGLQGDNKLFLQEPMDRWVWSREDRYGREHRAMLFDEGLEKLVSVVFEVAPLDDVDLPAPVDVSAEGEPEGLPEGLPEGEAVPFPEKTL